MKRIQITLLSVCILFQVFPVVAQVHALPSEYDPDPKDICLKASNEWAMDIDVTKKNLEDIYQALNFSSYQIEVVNCTAIRSSALAYLDNSTGTRYILINPNRLTDLNTHYYSHLFVIAHEFGHHVLNHFGNDIVATQSNKRKMELEADKYAASIVKKLGGDYEDCAYALNEMQHPANDTYSDHPTKDKRLNAVKDVFDMNDNVIVPDVPDDDHSNFEDKFQSLDDVALLKYDGEVKESDIMYYYKKYNVFPKSIIYYEGSYWIYWEKDSRLQNFAVLWNYDEYPADQVKKYFADGYNIEFIEKINGKTFIVFLKYATTFNQMTRLISKADFKGRTGEYDTKIRENLNDDYGIQNIFSYDDDSYLVLLTKYARRSDFAWAFRDTFDDLEDWQHDRESEGYNVMNCFKYIDDSYFAFMQKTENVTDWTVASFDGSNEQKIIDKIRAGFSIDNITVDNDYVHFTLVKY